MIDKVEQLVMLPLEALQTDARIQMRAKRDLNAIAEYSQVMRVDGCDKFPPLRVVNDAERGKRWVWDGEHRKEAAHAAGLVEFPCLVRPGTLDDAIWLALSANKGHGVRRSNKDKEKAVQCALRKRPELTDSAIAEHVGVDHKTVSKHRGQLEKIGEIPKQKVRETADGFKFTVNGKRRRGEVDLAPSSADQHALDPQPREIACWEIPNIKTGGPASTEASTDRPCPSDSTEVSEEDVSGDADQPAPTRSEASGPLESAVRAESEAPTERDDEVLLDDGPPADDRAPAENSPTPSDPSAERPKKNPRREPSRLAGGGERTRQSREAKKDIAQSVKKALALMDGKAALHIPFVEVQVLLKNVLTRLKEV